MTFAFIRRYFIAVSSKLTCSNYELCSPTNHIRRVLRPQSILQLLLGPKSADSAPSREGAAPARQRHFWFTARYTRDVFLPREVQRSVFSKTVHFSELTTRIRRNTCEPGYALFFQACPEISALWMNRVETIQREAVCTTDWPERRLQGESFGIKRIAPRPSNSNKDGCNF